MFDWDLKKSSPCSEVTVSALNGSTDDVFGGCALHC
jgi:hypothetical protein